MSSSPNIHQLRSRLARLEMTEEQFRSVGHDLVDRIAGPNVIHGNVLTVYQYANEFITGTQEWVSKVGSG